MDFTFRQPPRVELSVGSTLLGPEESVDGSSARRQAGAFTGVSGAGRAAGALFPLAVAAVDSSSLFCTSSGPELPPSPLMMRRRRGAVVNLCWKYGEARVAFWHGLDEGFARRKPLP